MGIVLETLMIIPVHVGVLLGMIGILPALPALAGKSPSNHWQLAAISASVVIGAIGMMAGMAHMMVGSAI